MKRVKLGIYEHYKGKRYEVIGIGKDAETLEDIVIYRALYDSAEFGDKALWVRSLRVFTEEIIIDGNSVPRFKYIG